MVPLTTEESKKISLASQLISEAEYSVALSGAGISTPSGIPDFRSPGSGIWTKYSPMEVASLTAFRYHPERFFDWIRPFINSVFLANPNSAHLSLADLEEHSHLQAIVTQNIDALHQKAGSKNVIEVHGTYQTMSCLGCFNQIEANLDLLTSFLEKGEIPCCSDCGQILKPDIILYEEQLPIEIWQQARNEITKCDLLLVLGSSLTVTPVCDLPYLAVVSGAKLIIINNTYTHMDDMAQVTIHGELAEIVPIIKDKVLYEKKK